ncbi:flippase [Patescibacteria group bacterium]|nr:flippase [Patescibacteria group bacterium]
MNYARAIAFNTIIQLVGKAITVATSVLIIAYLTRYLGVMGYGDYATVFAYLGIFTVFVDLGLFVITVRDLASHPENEKSILGNMLGLRLVLGILIFGTASLIAFGLPYSAIVKTGIVIGSIAQFLSSLNQIPLSLFQTRLVMYKAAVADIIGRLIMLIAIVWFIQLNLGFLYIIWGVVIANAAIFLLGFIMLQLMLPIYPMFNWQTWKRMLTSALPMGIVIILSTIYFRVDMVMLSMMKSNYDVGIYGAPYKILEVLLVVPSIFMSSVLPVMTRAFNHDKAIVKNIFRKSFDFLSIAALPLIFGTFVVATPLMVLMAGKEFVLSGPVLMVLSLALGGFFLNGVMVYTIIAADQQKRLIKPYIIATIFNITMNFVLIPRFSYFGAAAATVATELLILIISSYIVKTQLGFSPSWLVFSKALLASIVMAIVLILCASLNVLWLVPIGAVSYITLLFITKAVTKKDLQVIFSKAGS